MEVEAPNSTSIMNIWAARTNKDVGFESEIHCDSHCA